MCSEAVLTIARMASEPAPCRLRDGLTRREFDAVVAAATWYAKYHEPMIASLAGDGSAAAFATRERHQLLYDALSKLGIRLRRPAGIRALPS